MNKLTVKAAVAVTLWTVLGAGSAMAGGRLCVNGPEILLSTGQFLPSCPVRAKKSTHPPAIRVQGAGELRAGWFCPYPHRPTDSVFSGGSAYIIKDDVRRADGCR